jgi:hypothetical protein
MEENMPLTAGFNAQEAKELLEICYEVNGRVVKGDPKPPPPTPFPPDFELPPAPTKWQLFYAPKSTFKPGDNYFEIWQSINKKNRFAVCFRGTTNAITSILEDALVIMIPASVSFKLRKKHTISLAKDPRARVHFGFTIGLASMIPDLLIQLELILGLSPAPELFIIGHSQGAALATLCTSFLHYQHLYTIEPVNRKTYVFAQPKPGNDYYGYDFEHITANCDCVNSKGFRVTNTQDWVPQIPLSIQLPSDLSHPNPLTTTDIYSKYPLLKKVIETIESLKLPTTLNYFGCGTPILLEGIPGTNSADPNDFFWQHHAAQYYNLLIKQFLTTG